MRVVLAYPNFFLQLAKSAFKPRELQYRVLGLAPAQHPQQFHFVELYYLSLRSILPKAIGFTL